MPKSSPEESWIARKLRDDGWVVVNTNDGFPDLFCVKDGSVKLVEVKLPPDHLRTNQSNVVETLRAAGVTVDIIVGEYKGQQTVVLRHFTWKRLMTLKQDNDFSSIDATVRVLMEIATPERIKEWWKVNEPKMRTEGRRSR